MRYLTITQDTANWLLANTRIRDAMSAALTELSELPHLAVGVLAVGPLRIAALRNKSLLAIWNTDYLSAQGAESWGMIKLTGGEGLLDEPQLLTETFERLLYVTNQRLQGLLLDTLCIHKTLGDEVHTCLAGRGSAARQKSIAYYEGATMGAVAGRRSIICVGPSRLVDRLVSAVRIASHELPALIRSANDLVLNSQKRPAIDAAIASSLITTLNRARFANDTAETDTFEELPPLEGASRASNPYATLHLTYADWIVPDSSLTPAQRAIVESDLILRHPLRIVGAAGSGKTLVMQLLALRRLVLAEQNQSHLSVLYITHNAAMMESVSDRFVALGGEQYLHSMSDRRLTVTTLFALSMKELDVNETAVINRDARETKQFQTTQLADIIRNIFTTRASALPDCRILQQVSNSQELLPALSALIAQEIGVVIKGHELAAHRRLYTQSEQAFSRFHGVLSELERDIVFDIFEEYQQLLESCEVLDADDLALTAVGRLRTPLWQMLRKRKGYDFIFVDETQLFNENERRVFALVSRGDKPYVPIVLALDQAQELRGANSSGFGRLGIEEMQQRELASVHRSTSAIVALAFNIIQKTTDLFGVNFPDLTRRTEAVIGDDHKLAAFPRLLRANHGEDLGQLIVRQVQSLRSGSIRQIAVIVHGERYWRTVQSALTTDFKQLRVLTVRGEKMPVDGPIVVLSQPEYVGGQEFDAVIAVGVEQGVVPPPLQGSAAIAITFEQQALRELYVSFTRARYQLLIINSAGSVPSNLLNDAISANLLRVG